MKYFSFKILILFILLPPFLYILTVQSVEKYLQDKYSNEIEDLYLGNTRHLFNGSVRLKDAVNNNIDRFLKSKALIPYGIRLNITVATKQGALLYPSPFEETTEPLSQFDPARVAADNYTIMHEGLTMHVDLKLEHNTLLSNVFLAFYIFASALALYFYYLSGFRKTRIDELEKNAAIDQLLKIEKEHTDNLATLKNEKENLTARYNQMQKEFENEKIKASRNEDEMLKEIIALEEKIEENLAGQTKQQEEIDALEKRIDRFEGGKQKTKGSVSMRKRFNTLYKNIAVSDKAISGFMDLSDSMKIKGEEIIHQLNENHKRVPVKRRVFRKFS